MGLIFHPFGYILPMNLLLCRSRLAGEKPKDVSNKLDFKSFMEHYKSYAVAQALFNKMVKLL